MKDVHEEASYEEMRAFMAAIAQNSVQFLGEQPIKMTEIEPGKELGLGTSFEVYAASVLMKNAMSCLFATMADGLIYSDIGEPRLLVHENGEVDPRVMKGISFRYVVNMNFPEFSISLGEELKKAVKAGPVANKLWQLVDGEGKTLYFQAIGKKTPQNTTPPRKRATAVRVPDDLT